MTKKQKQNSKSLGNMFGEKEQEAMIVFSMLADAIINKHLICSSKTGLEEDLCKKEVVTIDNYGRHFDSKMVVLTDGMNETVVNIY